MGGNDHWVPVRGAVRAEEGGTVVLHFITILIKVRTLFQGKTFLYFQKITKYSLFQTLKKIIKLFFRIIKLF